MATSMLWRVSSRPIRTVANPNPACQPALADRPLRDGCTLPRPSESRTTRGFGRGLINRICIRNLPTNPPHQAHLDYAVDNPAHGRPRHASENFELIVEGCPSYSTKTAMPIIV